MWHPPVYHTRYDYCGRPYKVLVKKGYNEKVWVAYSKPRHHKGHAHASKDYHRGDRFHRRGW